MNAISKLIARYFTRRYNIETETKIQQWLIDGKFSEEKDEALYELFIKLESRSNREVYNSLKEVNKKLGFKRSKSWFMRGSLPRVAALILPLILSLSIYFYQSRGVEMIEIVTMVGERRELKLPDGSMVWMNACSKIVYPEKFNDTTRVVTLEGEAYFSVKKSEKKEFIVTTKELSIEVLGTQFNVKAYSEDQLATTTLINGKVAIILPEERYTLLPDQKFIYNSIEKSSFVEKVSNRRVGWREGDLIFSDRTISEILKELERHYDVEFKYSQNILSNDRYSLKFTNSESIEQILSVLQDVVGGFSYINENRSIKIQIK